MIRELKCPQCRAVINWQGNPHRPFCSERCRLIDLGQWADGAYRIQGPSHDPLGEEEIPEIHEDSQDIERS